MMQWSPDTSPDAVQAGGGYAYADSADQRLQPHPSQRHGVPLVPGRPDPAHRGRRRPRPPRRSPPSRTEQEHASPGRYQVVLGTHGPDLRLARRHHSVRHLELRLPARHRSPTCSSRWPTAQPGQRAERAHRRARRGRRPSDQRAVLRDRHQLHAALRGALRPAVLLGRHVGQRGHRSGNDDLHRAPPAAPSSRSTRPSSGRCS